MLHVNSQCAVKIHEAWLAIQHKYLL